MLPFLRGAGQQIVYEACQRASVLHGGRQTGWANPADGAETPVSAKGRVPRKPERGWTFDFSWRTPSPCLVIYPTVQLLAGWVAMIQV